MFPLRTIEDVLTLSLGIVVAYVLYVYINGFLDFHYGQGERAQRNEAIDAVVTGTSVIFFVVLFWVVYKFVVSLL
jgi:hypothetical protein